MPLQCTFFRQNTSGNNTFLSWVLEFLRIAIPGLIAVFGNALCYLSVETDDDLFLLCKLELVYWKFYEGRRGLWG